MRNNSKIDGSELDDILSELKGASYDLIPKDTISFTEKKLVNDTDYIAVLTREYEYLLGKNISSLTFEKAY